MAELELAKPEVMVGSALDDFLDLPPVPTTPWLRASDEAGLMRQYVVGIGLCYSFSPKELADLRYDGGGGGGDEGFRVNEEGGGYL